MDMKGGKPASLDDTMLGYLAAEAASSVVVGSSSVARHGFSIFTCVVSHGMTPSLAPLSCVSEHENLPLHYTTQHSEAERAVVVGCSHDT